MSKHSNTGIAMVKIATIFSALMALYLMAASLKVYLRFFSSDTLYLFQIISQACDFLALSSIIYYLFAGCYRQGLAFLFWPSLLAAAGSLIRLVAYYQSMVPLVYYAIVTVLFVLVAILLKKGGANKRVSALLLVNLIAAIAVYGYSLFLRVQYVGGQDMDLAYVVGIWNLLGIFFSTNFMLYLLLKFAAALNSLVAKDQTAPGPAACDLQQKLAALQASYGSGRLTEAQYLQKRQEYIDNF